MANYNQFKLGKLKDLSEKERIIEYNRTIKHNPKPSDFSIIQAAREYYGTEVELDEKEKIKRMRIWMYDSKQAKDGPASMDIGCKKACCGKKIKLLDK